MQLKPNLTFSNKCCTVTMCPLPVSPPGSCHCGSCLCDDTDKRGLVTGRYCECDDSECLDEETGEVCGGM